MNSAVKTIYNFPSCRRGRIKGEEEDGSERGEEEEGKGRGRGKGEGVEGEEAEREGGEEKGKTEILE